MKFSILFDQVSTRFGNISGYFFERPTNEVTKITIDKTIKSMFLIGYCPMNISIKHKLKIIKAVEKFEGNTNITTNNMGSQSLIKELLKFNFFSRFLDI